MIEKNATRNGWRGWDAGKRLWQIEATPGNGAGEFRAHNGERYLWAASLADMSARLAVTASDPQTAAGAAREVAHLALLARLERQISRTGDPTLKAAARQRLDALRRKGAAP